MHVVIGGGVTRLPVCEALVASALYHFVGPFRVADTARVVAKIKLGAVTAKVSFRSCGDKC